MSKPKYSWEREAQDTTKDTVGAGIGRYVIITAGILILTVCFVGILSLLGVVTKRADCDPKGVREWIRCYKSGS